MKKRLTVWAEKKVRFDGNVQYSFTPGQNRRDIEDSLGSDFTMDHISAVEIEIREVKQGHVSKYKPQSTESSNGLK